MLSPLPLPWSIAIATGVGVGRSMTPLPGVRSAPSGPHLRVRVSIEVTEHWTPRELKRRAVFPDLSSVVFSLS